jgi:diketogulonate reductase-like aldo/keto reductase
MNIFLTTKAHKVFLTAKYAKNNLQKAEKKLTINHYSLFIIHYSLFRVPQTFF